MQITIQSVPPQYFMYHSFLNGGKHIFISLNFIVLVRVRFEELDEINIVGDDDELQFFIFVGFDQSDQRLGQILDVFLVQVGGGFV